MVELLLYILRCLKAGYLFISLFFNKTKYICSVFMSCFDFPSREEKKKKLLFHPLHPSKSLFLSMHMTAANRGEEEEDTSSRTRLREGICLDWVISYSGITKVRLRVT